MRAFWDFLVMLADAQLMSELNHHTVEFNFEIVWRTSSAWNRSIMSEKEYRKMQGMKPKYSIFDEVN